MRTAAADRNEQQAFQSFLLLAADAPAEREPQPLLHPAAQAGDVAFEGATAGQQHLERYQPGNGPLEQNAWPVGAGPAKRVQPTGPVKADLALRNLDIAILGFDFCGMLQALSACAIDMGVGHCLDAQLLGQRMQYRHRHVQRVFQECAQITHRAELRGETKPVVLAALLRDQCVVGIVQVEVTG